MNQQRVDFERDVDARLVEMAERSDRHVPRYPDSRSTDYGEPAPSWAQMHPRLIRAWAWCRAIGWMIRGHGA